MSKILVLLPVALLTTIAFYSTAFGQAEEGDEVYIIPWQIPQDENGNRVVTVREDQTVILGARWGACTRGLAQAWSRNANVHYQIDGNPLLASTRDGRAYWTRPQAVARGETGCVNGSSIIRFVFWRYEYGTMAPGPHEVYIHYWIGHQLVDGGDWDGDGRVDHYPDWGLEVPFTIIVLDWRSQEPGVSPREDGPRGRASAGPLFVSNPYTSVGDDLS
jgi:hypothetical protein